MNFILRAICRLPTGRPNIISLGMRVRLLIKQRLQCFVRRNTIPLETRVRLVTKQRLPERFVRRNLIRLETKVRLLTKQRLPERFVSRNIIPAGTRVRLLIKQRLPQHFVLLKRGVYPLSLVRPLKLAHLGRLPAHVRRLPQQFVRLERDVYRLSLVRPLNITHLRRLPAHMRTKLGRALVEPIKSGVNKPPPMAPLNLKHSRAEPVGVRPPV